MYTNTKYLEVDVIINTRIRGAGSMGYRKWKREQDRSKGREDVRGGFRRKGVWVEGTVVFWIDVYQN